MNAIETGVLAFATSYVLVSPFWVVLRPRPFSFVLGATLVAAIALVLELAFQLGSGAYAGDPILVVLVAPLIEELLKFGVSGGTGANYASAAGAGLGFAASENGLYFFAAWGDPIASLLLLVGIRAVTDPLLHSTTTTIATATFHGRWWALPAAIAVHVLWNTTSVVAGSLDFVPALVLIGSAALALTALALLVRRSPVLAEDLSDHRRLNPLTGVFTSTG